MFVGMIVIWTQIFFRHVIVSIEAYSASTEPKNDLRFKWIVESDIGFMLEFFQY